MNYRFVYLLLFSSLFFACKSAEKLAQEKLAWEEAATAIKEIKKGGLVVLIPSHKEKFKAIDRLLASKDVSEKRKKEIQENKDRDILSIKEYSKKMIGAFREQYKFSSIYFIADSSFNEFKAGKREKIFFNDSMQIDNSIKMDYPNSYRLGIRLGSDQIIVIRDKNGQLMKDPFPWRHTYYFWMGIGFNAWVDNIEAMKNDAGRFSRRFNKFYRSVMEKETNIRLNQ